MYGRRWIVLFGSDPLGCDVSAESPAPGAGRSRRLIVVGVAAVAITVAFFFLPMSQYVQRLRDFFEQAGAWGWGIYVLVYVLATVCLVPASALTLLAGGVYGFVIAFILTVIASNLGALSSFLLGRSVLRSRVESWAANAPKFSALREAIGRSGFKIVALTRLSPIFPYTLLNYALGLTPISTAQYALATFLGMLPGTAVFVYLGALSGELAGGDRPHALKLASQIAGLLATIAATFYIARMAKRALNEGRASSEGKPHEQS